MLIVSEETAPYLWSQESLELLSCNQMLFSQFSFIGLFCFCQQIAISFELQELFRLPKRVMLLNLFFNQSALDWSVFLNNCLFVRIIRIIIDVLMTIVSHAALSDLMFSWPFSRKNTRHASRDCYLHKLDLLHSFQSCNFIIMIGTTFTSQHSCCLSVSSRCYNGQKRPQSPKKKIKSSRGKQDNKRCFRRRKKFQINKTRVYSQCCHYHLERLI
jgi:hypothetical protein